MKSYFVSKLLKVSIGLANLQQRCKCENLLQVVYDKDARLRKD